MQNDPNENELAAAPAEVQENVSENTEATEAVSSENTSEAAAAE